MVDRCAATPQHSCDTVCQWLDPAGSCTCTCYADEDVDEDGQRDEIVTEDMYTHPSRILEDQCRETESRLNEGEPPCRGSTQQDIDNWHDSGSTDPRMLVQRTGTWTCTFQR